MRKRKLFDRLYFNYYYLPTENYHARIIYSKCTLNLNLKEFSKTLHLSNTRNSNETSVIKKYFIYLLIFKFGENFANGNYITTGERYFNDLFSAFSNVH